MQSSTSTPHSETLSLETSHLLSILESWSEWTLKKNYKKLPRAFLTEHTDLLFLHFSIHFNLFFVNLQYFHQIKPVIDENFMGSHENTDTGFWESFLEIQNVRVHIRNFLLLMNWLRVCSSGVNICYSGINWLFSWKAVCRHFKFLSMFIYHDYQKFLHAEIDWPSTKLIWNNSINPECEGEKVTSFQINSFLYITNVLLLALVLQRQKHTWELMQAVSFCKAGMVNKALPLARKQSG